MTPHNTLRCVDGCIVTKPVKFWAISSIFTEVMRKSCFMVSIVIRGRIKNQRTIVECYSIRTNNKGKNKESKNYSGKL